MTRTISAMTRSISIITLLGVLAALPCRADDRTNTAARQLGNALSANADPGTPTVERCVAEHEKARMAQIAEQWLQARESLSVCSAEACPLGIRSDCRTWQEELALKLPTVLVVVERDDDGKSPVRVQVDGNEFELRAPAQAIDLLPGPHHLRFILEPYPAIEQDVSLATGEKNRLVQVRFAREVLPAAPVAPPRLTPVSATPPASSALRPVPVASYIYAGGALVAFAASTALLVSALSLRADARETCAPVCRSEARHSIESRLLVADISGLTGLALTGLSLYTWATRPVVFATVTASPPSRSFTLALTGSF